VKRTIFFVALSLVLGASIFLPGTGSAFTLTNSWSVNSIYAGYWWQANEVSTYDKIELFIISGPVTFAGTGIVNYSTPTISDSSWTANAINPTYAMASGPTITTGNLNFDMVFNDAATPFEMDMLYWNNGVVAWAGSFDYVGTGTGGNFDTWNYLIRDVLYSDGCRYDRSPVPEPATMLLLGSSLIGLAGFGRKRLFKKV